MSKIEIRRWDNNKVIHSGNFKTIKECVEDAVKKDISLYKAYLAGVDLSGTNLSGADLAKAILYKADLAKTDLYKADLSEANLAKTDLYEANLTEASLYKANLYEANLYEVDLYEVDLTEAYLTGANLYIARGVRTFTAGNYNRLCFTYIYNNEQRWQLGCFNGNYEETKKAVKEKYGKDSHYYRMIEATKDSI